MGWIRILLLLIRGILRDRTKLAAENLALWAEVQAFLDYDETGRRGPVIGRARKDRKAVHWSNFGVECFGRVRVYFRVQAMADSFQINGRS